MASVLYNDAPIQNIQNLSAASMSSTIAAKGNGRYMLFLQWALYQSGEYRDAVDGHWRDSVQVALDAVRANSYDDGKGTYAPLTGTRVSQKFLQALFDDYLDTPDHKTVLV